MELSDNSPDAERLRIEESRRMTPAQKLQRVESLNREALELEKARIREHYGDVSDEEMRMRIGVWRLGREMMVTIFGWDPDVQGW